MRVLLITSPHLDHSAVHELKLGASKAARLAQCFVPMGLLSIAETIRSIATVDIKCINKEINRQRLELSKDFYADAADWLLESQPDLIGFMTETDSYHHLLRIFENVKARRKDVMTLLGGVHATAVHRQTLERCPYVDFVIRGEGEQALPQLIENLRVSRTLKEVGNLTYRARGFVMTNPDLPLIDDLDDLPWPDFTRVELAPEDVIYLEVGRGCPFRCNFCSTAPYWKRKHRIKSATRVIKEMKTLKDGFGRTDFNLTHDLLTTDRRWVLGFCKELTAANLGVTWTCSSRTDTMDIEQLDAMKQAGCRNVYYGVETGTADMQRRIAKDLDLSEARTIIRETTHRGIAPTIGFIAGLPGESHISLAGTLQEAMWYLSLPEATVHLFGFSPYHGSSNFEAIQDALEFDPSFVDFPLPPEVHNQNCSYMRENLDLFARYARLRQTTDLRGEVMRAAEEFMPNVNALKELVIEVVRVEDNVLRLLTTWTEWISERNAKSMESDTGKYSGTIADFLEFLSIYLTKYELMTGALRARLRWEVNKNHVRGYLRSWHFEKPHRDTPAHFMRANPSLVIDRFEEGYLPSGMADRAPGCYAFYALADDSARIVLLPPLGDIAVTISKDGIDQDDLVRVLTVGAGDQRKAEALVRELIGVLSREQILVDGEWRHASRIQTEGFMPPRPVSNRMTRS